MIDCDTLFFVFSFFIELDDRIMNIVFAGTPEIAAHQLQALILAGYPISGVYTQPDRPKGRGQHLEASPVKQQALTHQIPVFQPLTLRDAQVQAEIKNLKPDLMIVVAYGLMIPKAVLEIPKYGCWNVHVSQLPRWRGAAPIARAIEAGDTHTGVCIMQMDQGLDTGDILLESPLKISPQDTTWTLEKKLSQLGSQLLRQALDLHQKKLLKPTPQPLQGMTYASKLTKAEAQIDWNKTAHQIDCQIRAFNPWPVAYSMLQEQRIRIWDAHVLATHSPERPGTMVQISPEGIDVACGKETLLRLRVLQLDNGKALPVSALLQGRFGQNLVRGLRWTAADAVLHTALDTALDTVLDNPQGASHD